MNLINSYYCHQSSAIKITARSTTEVTNEERKSLELFNQKVKTLETASSMSVPTTFLPDLGTALQEISVYFVHRHLSRNNIQTEFEADFIPWFTILDRASVMQYT